MIVKSDRIYMEDGCRAGCLEIEGGAIKRFLPAGGAVNADYDFGRDRIIPGIFDTHNHGGFGVNISGASTEDEIKLYLKGSAANAVTALLPTTTDAEAMKLLCGMSDEPQDGARIMGIHSEGPWGARVGEKGIDTGYPKVDMEHARELYEACGGKLVLLGIAPEVENAGKAIDYFLSKNVAMAAYHTNANYEQANAAIDRGVTVATHLCNVMTGLHHRDVGVLGASLLRDEVWCELICDGLHVSFPMIEIILRIKDHNKIIMVSDSGAYAGAPVGTYRNPGQGVKSDRDNIHVTEDGFVLSDTGRLTGSSKPVIYGIKNLVEKIGVPLGDALAFSSLNPCKKYGFADRKGSLSAGKDADFAVIDDGFNVLYTFSEGRKVYDHTADTGLFNQKFIDEFMVK